ncbi:MAG: lamin tail domain-containing protein, partial [Candidatus Nealsonbacteria bacterium]|nr:lamin tail domain-containing protein [Candidatus Nealsonbacteria bacterium]
MGNLNRRFAAIRRALTHRAPVAVRSKASSGSRLRFESLEPRQLLDASAVISEFMAVNQTTLADFEGDYRDWIELHNPTAEALDLDGWYLTDDPLDLTQWRFPAVSLPADGHLVVFASDKDLTDPAAELHTNFKLSSAGDYLALVQPNGTTVEFAYEPVYPNQFDDVSYGLSSDLSVEGYFTLPTPGRPNVVQPVNDPTRFVMITEIMYHPASENDLEEYVELHNRGGWPVDLLDWQFSSGVQFTFPDVTIDPGEYLVVASDVDTFTAKYPTVTNVVGGWYGRLSNRDETIDLIDAVGVPIDSVHYADEGDWGYREIGELDVTYRGWVWTSEHDGGGKSLELVSPLVSNEYGQNWAASDTAEGTPGVVNSAAAADLPPILLDVAHQPAIPLSTDPVTITARVIDELATGVSVSLYVREDGNGEFNVLPMLDDGLSGDGAAGDGVYGRVLSPMSDGTIVEFYVGAADTAANARTWPAPAQTSTDPWNPTYEQAANLLFQVDDTFDADAVGLPGAQPIYYFIMTDAEWDDLLEIGNGGAERMSDAQMNMTFISVDGVETEIRYNTGIRHRGNGSRGTLPMNFHVNFVHDRPWHDVTAVNFNTRSTYLQVVGHLLFRMAGLPAEEGLPVQIRVNGANRSVAGSRMYGSYAQLQSYGSDYARYHFPDDDAGNLYKAITPTHDADLRYVGTNPQSYIDDGYSKSTNESENDWSDLIHLTNVLNNAPNDTYAEELAKVINVDQWLRWFAMEALLTNRETNLATGIGDDYSMYRGVEDPRFVLLPHDLDTILGSGGTAGMDDSIYRANALPAIERFLTHPAFAGRYHAMLRELIDTIFSPEQLHPFLVNTIGSWVPMEAIEQIESFVAGRSAAVLSQIPQGFTVDTGLPQSEGYYYSTDDDVIEIQGTADGAETGSVVIDGYVGNWSPFDGAWSFDGGTVVGRTLVGAGSEWSYLDDGSDQGTAWKETDYPAAEAWPSGPAELGYGDLSGQGGPEEATVVGYGPDLYGKYPTTYFRHWFDVEDGASIANATLMGKWDDGIVVYLNGQEIARDNMPDGPVDYLTLASSRIGGSAEDTFFELDITANPLPLVDGPNLLAVEIHQAHPASPDISFDLEMTEAIGPAAPGVQLRPGIHRATVQTFAGPDGSGAELTRQYVDFWYNDGSTQNVSGAITADVTWDAASGPYQVTGDVTVAAGATLTILPGTTVFFEAGTRMIVNGRLVAEGAPHNEIRFTAVPGGGSWNGLQFADTLADNRITYAVLEHATTDDGLIGVVNSNLLIDHCTFDHAQRRRIRTLDSSLIVRNSTFTDIFAPGEAPLTDNYSEHIWGRASDSGPFIIENNVFGTASGHNDVIDVDGHTSPATVMQYLGNVFLGGGDDALDLEGDALIEGNTFMHIRKDQWNTGTGDANVISAGAGHEFTMVRNTFYDVDHIAQVKDGAFLTLVNNTLVDAAISAVYFVRPGDTSAPGRGAYVEGNIFADTPVIFDKVQPDTDLVANRNVMPTAYHVYGADNIDEDPRVADPAGGDFSLLPGSPAAGAGPNGLDMGAAVPGGASISGEPIAVTAADHATLLFGGPGITHYRARLGGGEFGAETPVATPLVLTGLADGDYTVEVVGKDTVGVWQDETEATASKTWTVDSSLVLLQINEVLAVNTAAVEHEGTWPDLIELVNRGAAAIDLSGMSISDDENDPDKFVFPADTLLDAGGYLVLYADNNATTSGLHLGFSLDGSGDGVYLYDTAAAGGASLDQVEFGPQVRDLSIGRAGRHSQWALTQPTFATASPAADGNNVPQRVASPSAGWAASLKINEWLTDARVLLPDDFIELYNPDPLPVPLAGLFLTDHPTAQQNEHEIAALSFAPGSGYVVFIADSDELAGPDHLNFRLSPRFEMIGLFDPDLNEMDRVLYYSETTDYSRGRSGDGDPLFAQFRLPTPGVANRVTGSSNSVTLIEQGSEWQYLDDGSNLGSAWKETVYPPADAWDSGPAELGYGDAQQGVPEATVIGYGPDPNNKFITTYFRRTFEVADPTQFDELQLAIWRDDGAVVYVNGAEVRRTNMAAEGTIDYQTRALAGMSQSSENLFYNYTLDPAVLQSGPNVIAVEVHQSASDSSDLGFDLVLTGVIATPNTPMLATGLKLLDGLRITEIMYNPIENDDLEFVELQNVGGVALDLAGVRLADAIDFTFPPMLLAPGQSVVVVRDLEEFETFYGPGINVAGQYAGNLSNGGEDVVLQLAAPL